MIHEGGCHCGAIRYALNGEPLNGGQALCHCTDCRRSSGAPMVAWAMYRQDDFSLLSGTPIEYASSENGRRQFCGKCGTGLFYRNAETLPGIIDIQGATLDDPEAIAAAAHIQVAERIAWMEAADSLTKFDRYPPGV